MTGVTTHDVPEGTPAPGTGRDEPPGDGSGGGGRPERGGPALWQVIVLVLALCGLAAVIGWRLGSGGSDKPGPKSVDVGFFQDMTTHHQQALTMAFDYLQHGTDPLLTQIAREIVTYQSSEIGMMDTYLGQWGRNEPDPPLAMGWMQPPLPRREMTGLATAAQMQELANARGAELDALFTKLMIVHHAGGIHMAAYAAEHAALASTRRWAANMDAGQRGEISEMNSWRTRHGLSTVVPPLAELTPPAKTD